MSEAAVAEATSLDAPVKASNMGREVVVANQGGAVHVAPQNLANMIEFAQLMAKGGQMVGKPFREKPGACLGIASQAWRWGMDPYSCSQKAYVVSDAIGYEAQLVHAVILKNAPLLRRPKFEYFGSGPTRQCKVSFFVKDEPEPLEYLSPEFKDIPTKNSPLWKGDPDQQLGYYSVRAGARRHFPDIIMGVYTPEEIRENPQVLGEAGKAITLGGELDAAEHGEDIPDADFTDVGEQIARKAAEKKAAKDKKKGGPKAAPESVREEPTVEATASADKPAQAADQPNEPEDDGPTDEDIVAGVEADVKASKTGGKRDVIQAAKGALTRISETTDDKDLKARADSLLNRYDLD